MNSSDHNPKLPTWLFIVADVTLIGLAAFVAYVAGNKPSLVQLAIIVGSVGLGALVGLVPIVARYERQKNEALDERQRALEALSRTVAASAEQISIAAGGLHQIAELALKNLRMAEHLPQKLQEKVAEFQSQLAQATDTEKEELERELLALRTSESERLDSVSQRIAKLSAEWTRLEAATQQHLAAASDAVARLHAGTAGAIGKAQAAAEQALTEARVAAARGLGESAAQATRAVETARTAALADFEARIAGATQAAAATLTREIDAAIQRWAEAAPRPAPSAPSPLPAIAEPAPVEAPPPALPNPVVAENAIVPTDAAVAGGVTNEAPSAAVAEPVPAAPAAAPKRPRKVRREEHPHAEAPAAETAEATAAPERSEPAADAATEQSPSASTESAPIPTEKFTEIAGVAPVTAHPFPGAIQSGNGDHAAPAPDRPAADEGRPLRKRAARKPEPAPEEEPGLGLELDEPTSRAAAAGVLDRVLSSDGATRLVVTAYIGIGNRLFIRGEGPGLSWEKGVPLQFVSIGKWRWETSDATGPVQFKLYKNDDVECSGLGRQTLEPGHQQEVTAAF